MPEGVVFTLICAILLCLLTVSLPLFYNLLSNYRALELSWILWDIVLKLGMVFHDRYLWLLPWVEWRIWANRPIHSFIVGWLNICLQGTNYELFHPNHEYSEWHNILVAWGLFTPWTMKSSQGLVKYVIGCWTCPKTTSIYTKEKVVKMNMESPKDML